MSYLLPNSNTAVVHGGAGNDDMVDQSNRIKQPGVQGSFYHNTFLYGHGGDDRFMGESGLGPNEDFGGADLFDGGAGTDAVYYLQSNAGMVVDLAYDPAYGRAHAIGYSTDPGQFASGRVDFLVSIEEVYGSSYSDELYGSNGADHLSGWGGHDKIEGRGGDDTLEGGDGNDAIWGGAGNDVIRGDNGNDTLFGNDGHDLMEGGNGNDELYGGAGNDSMYGQAGFNILHGNDGNDTLLVGDAGEAYGGTGNDILVGGAGNDKLDGGSGDDTLQGLGGNDLLIAGPGNDVVDGGAGVDTGDFSDVWGATVTFNGLASGVVVGPASVDTFLNLEAIKLGGGADVFLGSNGANAVELGGGNDTALGGAGNDVLNGDGGNDLLYGQDGNDTLVGGDGTDALYGGAGNDLIAGGAGNDQLYGENGNDTLLGGSGSDLMDGGAGNDVLQAEGNDILIGGAGNDTINLAAGRQELRWTAGHTGFDTINGFSIAQDELVFSRGFFAGGVGPIDLEDQLLVFQSGNDTWLAANTAATGWDYIAVFTNTSAAVFGAAIDAGTIVSLIGVDYVG